MEYKQPWVWKFCKYWAFSACHLIPVKFHSNYSENSVCVRKNIQIIFWRRGLRDLRVDKLAGGGGGGGECDEDETAHQ